MELFNEGDIRFYAEDRQLKSSQVFYNPKRKFDRDLNVLLISSLKENTLNGLELFSGSGIRGMRLCAETDKFASFDFNDIKTAEIIHRNISLNKRRFRCDRLNVRGENSRFYVPDKIYGYIDIDPFGSPAPYLEAAMGLADRRSILAVSATDTAALLGSAQKACMRKYGSLSLKTSYSNEIGIRILIKRVAESAEEHSLHVKPLLFHFDGNFVRVYLGLSSKKKGKIGYAYQCSACPARTTKESKKCDYCGSSMTRIGPLWLDEIYDNGIVREMLSCLGENDRYVGYGKEALNDYLSALRSEESTFSYYTTSELASFFKKPEEKVSKFGSTVLSSKGFRTKMDFKRLARSLAY